MTAKLPPFTFVTGNVGKLREVERLLGHLPDHVAVDLPEIQSLDIREVLRAKATAAWERLERPLVVDETGLSLSALGGFPGPLVKWMLTAVGAAGIARTAHRLDEPRAAACCALLYTDGQREVIADVEVPGHLLAEPRGDGGFGWDPIFVPEGQQRTYAEMSATEKDRYGHRGKVWRRLCDELGVE